MRLLKYLLMAGVASACAQPLPSFEHMLAEKNWYFSTAVHPETHMIYARVNLGEPGLWSKIILERTAMPPSPL
jgi:hypothetical protein